MSQSSTSDISKSIKALGCIITVHSCIYSLSLKHTLKQFCVCQHCEETRKLELRGFNYFPTMSRMRSLLCDSKIFIMTVTWVCATTVTNCSHGHCAVLQCFVSAAVMLSLVLFLSHWLSSLLSLWLPPVSYVSGVPSISWTLSDSATGSLSCSIIGSHSLTCSLFSFYTYSHSVSLTLWFSLCFSTSQFLSLVSSIFVSLILLLVILWFLCLVLTDLFCNGFSFWFSPTGSLWVKQTTL